MSKKFSIQIGNHSDKGMVRESNQDSFGSAKTDWGEIFVVADGKFVVVPVITPAEIWLFV